MRNHPLVAAALVTGCLTSCGAAKVVRPTDPTYAAATGNDAAPAVCHDVTAAGEPLIVDWKPEDRTDLEVALKKGVAVVHYDCQTIKLLADCNVAGNYGYVGVTAKQQLIKLADNDEAKANLPFSGGNVGGSIATGSELNIALAIIGKRSTTFADLGRSQLKGKCDGATHFVRAATIGAFAMSTATSGEITAAGQLFGVGASGASTSKRAVANQDGDATACDSADPDADKPPGKCGAILRLQLIAITAQEGGAKPPPPPTGLVCPKGLVATNGKCGGAKDDRLKACHGGNLDACEAVCDRGDIDTCVFWGDVLKQKTTDENTPKYGPKAVKAYGKACDAGRADSCAFLGNFYWDGIGVPKDAAKGRELNVRACAVGSGAGCTSIGNSYIHGDGMPLDVRRGVAFVVRACALGNGVGCVIAGQAFNGVFGSGVPLDKSRAFDFFYRGCDAKESGGCYNSGLSLEHGDGVTANRPAAMDLYQRACRLGSAEGCARTKRSGK